MSQVGPSSGRYEIVVRGELGDQFAILFPPMMLVRRAGSTSLLGLVADQAQLLGLLSRVQELGCHIICVRQLDQFAEPASSPVANNPSATSPRASP
jgi:hypothetical protein